jgi:hypothetical protein
MNFGSPTEAARISTEKVPEQTVTKVPILAVQTTEVYNIQILEARICRWRSTEKVLANLDMSRYLLTREAKRANASRPSI